MKKKCNACGYRFHPNKKQVYIAHESQSAIEALTKTAQQFDVMDCPRCGCQVALAVRMPAADYEESKGNEE